MWLRFITNKHENSEYGENNKNCFLFLFRHSEQFMHTTGKSMNNRLSYCGLVDPKISASDKDLPVQSNFEAKELYH